MSLNKAEVLESEYANMKKSDRELELEEKVKSLTLYDNRAINDRDRDLSLKLFKLEDNERYSIGALELRNMKEMSVQRARDRENDMLKDRELALEDDKNRMLKMRQEMQVRKWDRDDRMREREIECNNEKEARRDLIHDRQKELDREWNRDKDRISESKSMMEAAKNAHLDILDARKRLVNTERDAEIDKLDAERRLKESTANAIERTYQNRTQFARDMSTIPGASYNIRLNRDFI